MRWFDAVLTYLSPNILITDPHWLKKWQQQHKEQFLRYAGFFFLVVAVGYIANYFLFDVPMGLEPTEFWFKFRFSMAAMAGVCALFYMSPLTRSTLYKLPAILACCIMCYTQAKVTIWFSQDAWLFFYIFMMTFTLFLGLNIVWSVFFTAAVCLIGSPVLVEAGISPEYIASATIVTLAFTVIVRRSAVTDVRNFLLSEENIANQKKLAEISSEYAERVQSFIPKIIAERMSSYMDNGKSVVEASIEALKAQKMEIACLFTDIRGFTQGSKDLDQFIIESVMPEVTACSTTIEDYSGIPRKVGDLIFAYFDDRSIHLNVIRAIASGIAVARLNETMNVSAAQMEIRRYILISAGEAMVGNFGGLDSSIEITALGTPVNFLSRVDDLTKEPALAELLNSGDLIVSEQAKQKVDELGVDLDFEHICLKTLHLKIRDFPEVSSLFKLAPTAQTGEIVRIIIERSST